MMNTIWHLAVNSCDCYDGGYRGAVETFYTRDDGYIRCSKCGKVPDEIEGRPIDHKHRVVLTVYHERRDGQTETYREVFYAEEGDE